MANTIPDWGDGLPFDLSEGPLEITRTDRHGGADVMHARSNTLNRRATGLTVSLVAFSEEASLELIALAGQLLESVSQNPSIQPLRVKGYEFRPK